MPAPCLPSTVQWDKQAHPFACPPPPLSPSIPLTTGQIIKGATELIDNFIENKCLHNK